MKVWAIKQETDFFLHKTHVYACKFYFVALYSYLFSFSMLKGILRSMKYIFYHEQFYCPMNINGAYHFDSLT